MKRLWTSFVMVNKIFWRKWSSILLMICILTAGLGTMMISNLTGDTETSALAVLCNMPDEVAPYFTNQGHLFTYEPCQDDLNVMKKALQRKEYQGILILEEKERLAEGTEAKELQALLYTAEEMNLRGALQEEIAGCLYEYYSKAYFQKLVTENGLDQMDYMLDDKLNSEELFQVDVLTVSEENDASGDANPTDAGEAADAPITLRSVLACMMTFAGCVGALEYSRRKRSINLVGLAGRTGILQFFAGLPVLYAGVLSFCLLLILGGLQLSFREVIAMMIFIAALWILAIVFGGLLQEKLLMAGIPFYLLIMLFSSPALFSFGQRLAAVEMLGNLYPLTWYFTIIG